jgi:hypothetical protein
MRETVVGLKQGIKTDSMILELFVQVECVMDMQAISARQYWI